MQKALQRNVEQKGLKESICGSTAGSDMLGWLKLLALDPCEPDVSRDSVQKFWYQALQLRKVWHISNAKCSQNSCIYSAKVEIFASCIVSIVSPLLSSEADLFFLVISVAVKTVCIFDYPNPKTTTFSSQSVHQRKRKLEQFLNGGNFKAASGLASKRSNYQNVKKVTCQKTVRNSCSSDGCLTFDNSFKQKQLPTDSNTSDSITTWDPFSEDIFSLVNKNESFNGSDFFSPENYIVQDQPLVDSCELISSSHSSSSEEKVQQAVGLLSAESESESENPPRAVIPIGPKFQAEVPDWRGPITKKYLYDSESLKWLGTKIWPIEEASPLSNMRRIGRGRPQFCSCVSPGSADCIRCHMLSARHNLQSELGPAFLSWKFDEMGEVVSKKWTMKEQIMFETFMKTYLLSNAANFWERAAKRIPSKSKKMILSYYYNVSNPRRMSRLTRSSHDQVDSDEDQVDDKYL
ncbi:DNA topoisomerase 2 [Citrus sinensis]|uniref:DNA topoisomerase 2 n=1 Tax=Citrus sinensis TaxID=2711 RepID=A0ACB8JVA8_CITSI|nr:DNA topoisomerase 2 [Citrus sinensis]